jgi:hypothetical protein
MFKATRIQRAGVLLVLFFALGAQAKEMRYKEMSLDLKDGDRVSVSAIRAIVKLIPSQTGASQIKLRVRKTLSDKAQASALESFNAWSFAFRRDEGVIRIEGKMPELGSVKWTDAPEFIMEIESPAVPAEVSIREGSVSAQGWKSSVHISMVEGQIHIVKSEGGLQLQLGHGEIHIDNHHGRVAIDSLAARLNMNDVQGDLLLDNFSGESKISALHGNIQLHSRLGNTAIQKSAGNFDFENGRGALALSDFDGALRGQTEEGAIAAQLIGDIDCNIESTQGNVSLKLPTGSGAQVHLQTEDGLLNVPTSFKNGKNGALKVASGQMPGAARGSIAVKSRSGSIRVH